LPYLNKIAFVPIFWLGMGLGLWAQETTLRIIAEQGHALEGAVVILASGKTFFTDSTGRVLVKSSSQNLPVTVAAEGFNRVNLKAPYPATLILRKKIVPVGLSADSLVSSIIKRAQKRTRSYQGFKSLTYEQHMASVSKVLFNIYPVTGLATPGPYDKGENYQAEVLKENTYTNRFDFRENILAKREAGRVAAENWMHLPDYTVHLWQNKSFLNGIINRGFYGPLSPEGFPFYEYQILGNYYLNEKVIYRLTFKPKQAGKPLFSGTVDVEASSGLPLQASFWAHKTGSLEAYDSVGITQVYYDGPEGFKQVKQNNFFSARHLGFHYSYQIKQMHLRYTFSTTSSKQPRGGEVYRIKPSAYEPNQKLWDSLRPTTLQPFDSGFYRNKNFASQPPKWRFYQGSRLHRRVLNYYNWTYKSHFLRTGHFFVKLPAAYRSLGFNAVEGPYFKQDIPFGLTYAHKEWQLAPTLRYGFADERLKPSAVLSYRFNPNKPQIISLAGGQSYQQFNGVEPVSPLVNTLYSLGLGQNLIRLYAKNFIQARYEFEATNGLSVQTQLDYAQRFPLFNNTQFSLLEPNTSFDFNNPTRNGVINKFGFQTHRALTLNVKLSYQFGQLYEHRYSQRYQHKLGFKHNLTVQKPRVYYNLKVGLPTAISETHYWYQEAGMHYAFRVANLGLSQLDLSLGHFPVNQNTPFVDYKHFNGLQILFLQPAPTPKNSIKQFSTLPFYNFSTNQAFAEAHYQHFFEGSLLTRVPGLKHTAVHSLAGFSGLALADGASFGEVFIGLSNILDLIRVEYSVGYSRQVGLIQNIRFNVDINTRYYLNNRPEKRLPN
jgi:hypothetical protein